RASPCGCRSRRRRPATSAAAPARSPGRGRSPARSATARASSPTATACSRCRGNGVVVEKPRRNCRGTGRERTTKRYQVKVPAGAKDGTRIRLKGKGEPGRNGGPDGDLYVVVQVDPSPLYERRGADLVLEVPVTYPEAVLGATVQIPTPDGPV